MRIDMSCTAGVPNFGYGCGSNHKLKGWSNIPPPFVRADHSHTDSDLGKIVAIRMAEGRKNSDYNKKHSNHSILTMLKSGPNSWVAEPDPSVDFDIMEFSIDFGQEESWSSIVSSTLNNYNGHLNWMHEKGRRAGKISCSNYARKTGKTSRLKSWLDDFPTIKI